MPAGHQLNARPAGVLIFVCLGLALVPSLNYFSARSYSQAMALEAEQPEASAAALQQSIQLAPWPSGRHYSNLALQALSRNELEPALLAISRAIQLDYHNARYYGLAAEILLALERKPAALAMLLRRQELNPYRSPHIYTELGDFYLEQQDEPHEALRWYQRGLQIFTARALSHYERYTPSHRYEAFNLMMKQATLHEKLSQLPQAKALRAEAQLLLRGGGRDMFVKSGYGNPVEAVNAYWQQLPEHHRNPSHSFDSILPGSQIQVPPPQLLNAEGIRFLQAERDIFAATLVYVIPRQDRPDSWLLLEDRLIGNETGWKIGSRRKLSP
ncbi:MAG: hypothetical protein CVV27_17765 [Candidatus Melainabacteria bacterium HGW-Melainabacteria-1]|nr:MAG: hypothetical protein CVV27_17765 [Candidatus Melainabacteria bacterium HGW-Melainabacteria-1]